MIIYKWFYLCEDGTILKEAVYEEIEIVSINKMFNDDKFKTKLSLRNKKFL